MSLNDLEKRVYDEVSQYLGKDESGHGMDHIERCIFTCISTCKGRSDRPRCVGLDRVAA